MSSANIKKALSEAVHARLRAKDVSRTKLDAGLFVYFCVGNGARSHARHLK
jgi:hypothetical protein